MHRSGRQPERPMKVDSDNGRLGSALQLLATRRSTQARFDNWLAAVQESYRHLRPFADGRDWRLSGIPILRRVALAVAAREHKSQELRTSVFRDHIGGV